MFLLQLSPLRIASFEKTTFPSLDKSPWITYYPFDQYLHIICLSLSTVISHTKFLSIILFLPYVCTRREFIWFAMSSNVQLNVFEFECLWTLLHNYILWILILVSQIPSIKCDLLVISINFYDLFCLTNLWTCLIA